MKKINHNPVNSGIMTTKLGEDVTIEQSFTIPQNANTLVVGSSGAGKTRSLFSPNILAGQGSYIISDPKGSLYKKYAGYLESKGYTIKLLDFLHPENSSMYNFFPFLHTEQDVLRVSFALAGEVQSKLEPYWDHTSCTLLSALISYLLEFGGRERQNIGELLDLIPLCQRIDGKISVMDEYMKKAKYRSPESFAVRQYEKVGVASAKTFNSILSTLESKIGTFDCEGTRRMMQENEICFNEIGEKPTALFVIVSDFDRSMDKLANIFFTQAMSELILHADKDYPTQSLPVPVRFFLDDFATNVVIEGFPRMISSIRGRNVSAMLAIQSESQLQAAYGPDKETIIANCDTYVYCGGNDLNTATSVAMRCNRNLDRVLNMPVGKAWIFRRGEKPLYTNLLDLEECEKDTGYKQISVKEKEHICENFLEIDGVFL